MRMGKEVQGSPVKMTADCFPGLGEMSDHTGADDTNFYQGEFQWHTKVRDDDHPRQIHGKYQRNRSRERIGRVLKGRITIELPTTAS